MPGLAHRRGTCRSPLHHEALYLAALAVPDTEREAKERALRQATGDTANPFRRRLLRQWAFSRLGWGDLDGAVEMALELPAPIRRMIRRAVLAEKIVAALQRMPPSHYGRPSRRWRACRSPA